MFNKEIIELIDNELKQGSGLEVKTEKGNVVVVRKVEKRTVVYPPKAPKIQ
mgnify:CR=1 FL=1